MAKVAVVGAGLAGLACGRRLQTAGHQVIWLEKSRGVGGRLATRRLDGGGWVDQGVRYWSPSSPGLTSLTQSLVAQGILHEWQAQGYGWKDGLQPRPTVAYCAEQGINAIAKYLAQGCDIHRQQRITGLTKTSRGWQLTAADINEDILADRVVLATPAPQALSLLAPLDSLAAAAVSRVTYDACLSLMVTYGGLGALPKLAENGWHITAEHPVLAWLSLDSSKPLVHSPVNAVLLQSQAGFAAQYFTQLDTTETAAERSLQQATTAQMLAAAAEILPGLISPKNYRLHRWRYSFVQQPHPGDILKTQWPSLVCCGDWCSPDHLTNLDAAYRSGVAAAEYLLA